MWSLSTRVGAEFTGAWKTKKSVLRLTPENGLNHVSQFANDGIACHPLAAQPACRYAGTKQNAPPQIKSGGSMRQRSSVYGLWLAVILLAALPAPVAAQAPTVTVFEGACLITGDGGTPIDDSAFVVEGNRITQVGRKGALTEIGRAH